jgi:hypothetical protein
VDLDTADLEVVTLAGDAPPATPRTDGRRRRRRWPFPIVTIVVLAGLLILPVKANLAAGEFRRLADVWAQAQALEPARQTAIDQLATASFAPDETHMAHGTALLDDEEAARLAVLRGRLDGWLVPDQQLEHLRDLMRSAMSLEVADLRAAAASLRRKAALPDSPFGVTTTNQLDTVGRRLADLRLRFSQGPTAASTPVTLTAGQGDLAALHRYLDEPTGTVLVTTDGTRQLRLLDLDHSRTSTLDMGANTSASEIVARRGYIAVLVETPADGLVLATVPTGAGPPRLLAHQATAITPAPEPDRVWAATAQGAIEVDGTGAVLAGPVPLPAGADLAGATTAALFTQRLDGEVLVTTVANGVSRVLADNGEIIATSGPEVAWAAATKSSSGQLSATLNLSTDSGRTSHVLVNAHDTLTTGQAIAIGPGAFSPDGRRLALWWLERLTALRSTTVFAVIDLSDGHSEAVAGTVDVLVPGSVAWAPDSRRVFFVRGQQVTQLWSLQPGHGRAETVRIRGIETDNVAALASPAA